MSVSERSSKSIFGYYNVTLHDGSGKEIARGSSSKSKEAARQLAYADLMNKQNKK